MFIQVTPGITIDDFFKNGGTIEYEITSDEISPNNPNFENWDSIKDSLYTGFYFPVSDAITQGAVEATQVINYADAWTKLITRVERLGGEVIYKKLNSGKFSATFKLNI
ncbi:TPA: hypothetical protein IBI84_003616 [Escherichia coli]|uniref:Uncharacterized protein n=1 Tax=Escherichia coli TaxID=562 RepID=A0A3R0MW85_ECOLX|nr:hypothetical protein [Escherichia coli]EEX5262931.1 hypothetical protein [Escherichia coli O157]EFA4192803.1 hypothetical protein [Escherichia coli O96]EJE7370908.1 hypothetical protein [Shigella dysenteriae]EER1408985.1 hypothetical protein [Escherichia coli]EEW7862184.1 hypothetical protein [Escherichia coli]